jgi:hypothetical protein
MREATSRNSQVGMALLRTSFSLGLLSVSVLIPLCAQNGQVAGPVTGIVFDRSAGALRPILGIPGASVLGDPLTLGYGLSNAVVSPHQDSAFAIGTDSSLHLLRINSGSAFEVACTACPSKAEGAIFSPSGSSVALYSAGRVQILTALSTTPVAGASFSVGSVTGVSTHGVRFESPAAPPMALSDDGGWLLVGTKDSVELFSANGGTRQLLSTMSNPLVAFAAGGHDAAIADGKDGLVWIHDASGAAAQQQLAPASVPLHRFSGLAFSADGSQLLTATSDGSVVSVALASGNSTTTQCGCTPSELVPMGSVLRLNEIGGGPLWLFDGTTPQPRVVFVPAMVAAQ